MKKIKQAGVEVILPVQKTEEVLSEKTTMAEGTLTETIEKQYSRLNHIYLKFQNQKRRFHYNSITSGVELHYLSCNGPNSLFGATAPEFDFLAFARVIFASAQGSLVELGIGPIVTGGLLMQLLRGSDILKFDFKTLQNVVFQTATKMVTYIVIVAESIVYGAAVYGPGIIWIQSRCCT